jgi:hypothetical protein
MPKINLKQIAGGASDAFSKIGDAAKQVGTNIGYGPGGLSISGNFNQVVKSKVEGNKIKSPIRKLFIPNGGKFASPLILPTDLDDEHYMIFNIVERKRDQKEEIGTKKIFRSIVLPIPSNLGINHSVDYSNENLGIFGGAASGNIELQDLSSAVSQVSDEAKAAFESFKTAANSLDRKSDPKNTSELAASATKLTGLLGPVVAGALASKLGGKLGAALGVAATGGGALSGLSVSTGIALNPHMAVLFKGVGFKEHQFSYKFVARNKEESDRIKDVISVLQYHMHPDFQYGNLAFSYPDEFEIEFSSALQPYLFNFNTCVLKNMTVNYNGENTPIFFEQTKAPVSIEISLQFQETKIKTRGDFDKNTASDMFYI